MRFIALKTCDGGAKGRISFCCKALKVTRQGFHGYLKNRNKPWKHEELAAKMMEILHEDECNDTVENNIRSHAERVWSKAKHEQRRRQM